MLCSRNVGGGAVVGLQQVLRECLTSEGTFERRPHSEPTPSSFPRPPRLREPPCLCLTLTRLSASPLCSRHTGLLAVPQTCQARPYLRTFSLSVPSARKPLPPDLRAARVLTSSRSLLQCPPRRDPPQSPCLCDTLHTTPSCALPQFASPVYIAT